MQTFRISCRATEAINNRYLARWRLTNTDVQRKFYAVAQFNEKSNFVHPSSNYILSRLNETIEYHNCDQITITHIIWLMKDLSTICHTRNRICILQPSNLSTRYSAFSLLNVLFFLLLGVLASDAIEVPPWLRVGSSCDRIPFRRVSFPVRKRYRVPHWKRSREKITNASRAIIYRDEVCLSLYPSFSFFHPRSSPRRALAEVQRTTSGRARPLIDRWSSETRSR